MKNPKWNLKSNSIYISTKIKYVEINVTQDVVLKFLKYFKAFY